MDLQAAKRTLSVTESVYDNFEERAVDADFVLPDYCPDIAAILKCTMRPVITARQWSGDRLMVDGVTQLRVLYLDEDRRVPYCYEVSQPFAASFRMENDCPNCHRFVSVKTDYVNCRATGPRRVDIHGAFRVLLNMIGEGSREVMTDPKADGVFCRTHTVSCSVPLAETEKTFTVNEAMDIGVRVERGLYSDATVRVTDCKQLMNKAIVKGLLLIKSLYIAQEDGSMKTTQQEIPFSQIVDVEGMREDWMCGVQATLGESDIRLQQETTGSALLSVVCKITVFVRCSRCESAEVVLDAYSSRHPLLCETMPLRVSRAEPSVRKALSVRQSVALPDGVTEVLDLWGDVKLTTQPIAENGVLRGEGCLLLSMLARDNEGHIGYYERTADFVCEPEEASAQAQLTLHMDGISGRINNGQLEFTAEMEAQIDSVSKEDLTVVCAVVPNEQESYSPSKAALKIVYAEEGESLWEIAKSCRASMQAIKEENRLSEEILREPTVLMIPLS